MGFFMAISPELLLAQSTHDIALNQFATNLSKQTIPFLNDVAKYLRNQLNNEWADLLTDKKIRRLNLFKKNIDERLAEIHTRMDDLLLAEFQDLAIQEGTFAVSSVNQVLTDDFIMLPVEDQKLWSAVTSNPLLINPKEGAIDFRDFMKDSTKNLRRQVGNMISFGYAEGLTLTEMIGSIVGTKKNKYKDGLVGGQSLNSVDAMVRTSINHIATQARLKVNQSNKRVTIGYRLIATLDSRTSNECKDHDQRVVLHADTYRPYPPFHRRCRTTPIDEIKDKALKDSDATRAANFKAQGDVKKGTVGQVPATTQYYDLLKQQSAAQQDLALGPARGKIFRNAGLTIPEFRKAMVDQMNQPITLSEMAAKNKKILEYMESNKLKRYLND